MGDQINWRILAHDATSIPVVPDESNTFDLLNLKENEALVYGEREYGINLKWGDPASGDNIRFRRESGSTEPINYSEPVAIGVRGGGFLHNQLREYGIGLVWRDLPCFEWKVEGPGQKPSDVVLSGEDIALFNTVANDYIFYDPRRYGVNLKWLKDKGKYNDTWFSSLKSAVVGKIKDEIDKHT